MQTLSFKMNFMKNQKVRTKPSKSQNASSCSSISIQPRTQPYQSQQPKSFNHNQNHNPNILHCPLNTMQSSHKKKILLVRHKNSKSKSIENSNKRKYSVDQFKTQVTPFEETGKSHPPTFQFDLYKQRKSVQDTMSSSEFLNFGLEKRCLLHQTKKASYLIKGDPYCEKCAVELITKRGMIAHKIEKEGIGKENREKILQNFVTQIEKIEPRYKEMGQKLQKYKEMIEIHYREEERKMQNVWNLILKQLTSAQQQWQTTVREQYNSALQTLNQLEKKLDSNLEYVVFMRNDIVCNISQIIDPHHISQSKFKSVIKSYEEELESIKENIKKTSSACVRIAETEGNLESIEKEIKNVFSSMVEDFEIEIGQKQKKECSKIMEEEDPYRLSFGTETQRLCSPSFKVV